MNCELFQIYIPFIGTKPLALITKLFYNTPHICNEVSPWATTHYTNYANRHCIGVTLRKYNQIAAHIVSIRCVINVKHVNEDRIPYNVCFSTNKAVTTRTIRYQKYLMCRNWQSLPPLKGSH
ncbi:dynactin subunit 5 [Trichinella spiralis]|uniref:dynactin subunit 5 n=1 Tax=Trichinella spiralis TaxID=6334 RepID=UPI0001EFE352|nr:dynactin subunit 5 [Trichinella spiralis]